MAQQYRGYRTFIELTSIVETGAWILCGIGAVVAFFGFYSGGLLGVASQAFGRGEIPLFARILGIIPGLGICFFAILVVVVMQHYRSAIDVARMTQELLVVARRQEMRDFGDNLNALSPARVPAKANPASSTSEYAKSTRSGPPPDTEEILEHAGTKIYRVGKNFFVDGDDQDYNSLYVAQMVINRART